MSTVCLMKDKVEEFRKALKDKDIKISDLLNMSTEDRIKLLEKYAGSNAKIVNTLFEQKLVLKNRMLGIQNLFSKLGEIGKYSKAGKEEVAKTLAEFKATQQERIFSPKENETFLNDLADKKLGIHISKEVANKVFDLSAKADSLRDVNPKMMGVSDEYLKARANLNKYIESQTPISLPTSVLKNLATIGRNFMLMNPATPIKTVEGQIVNSTMDLATRRLGNLSAGGEVGDLAKLANKEAWDTFKKTGGDSTKMNDMDDLRALNKGENFKNVTGLAQGKIAGTIERGVNWVGKITNKIAIDWEHNIVFTKFHQKAFFDMLNITASKLAKSEGLEGDALTTKAGEYFKDAVKIEPETEIGQLMRKEAQKQAARVTSTNDTITGSFALQTKNLLNNIGRKYLGGFPMGDNIIPMAKIPATLIGNAIENAGPGIPMGFRDYIQGRKLLQSTDLAEKYEGMSQMSDGLQKIIRTTGALGLAALITSLLTKNDFREDNSNSFVKIGNTWINAEYFTVIAPAIGGMMDAKQKGGNFIDNSINYVAGASKSLLRLPGLNEAVDLTKAITTGGKTAAYKYITDFLSSRAEPGFVKSLIQNRPIERLFFGAHGIESEEDVQLDTYKSVNWNTSTGKEMRALKDAVGQQEFDKANKEYNQQYQEELKKSVASPEYKQMTPDEKKKYITQLKNYVKNNILNQYR